MSGGNFYFKIGLGAFKRPYGPCRRFLCVRRQCWNDKEKIPLGVLVACIGCEHFIKYDNFVKNKELIIPKIKVPEKKCNDCEYMTKDDKEIRKRLDDTHIVLDRLKNKLLY